MKAADLDILLQEGEGVMLEYKESLSSSFARELVGFANTAGGRILLGVRDDGAVKGIADTNPLRARIQDIARNCDPPVKILLQRIGEVIVVTVRESESKPVQCSDGYFWRQGAVTQKLSRDEIRDLFRSEGAIRFDTSVCPRFRYPQDFDREKYAAWLQLSGITGRPSTEDVLVNIETAERSGAKLLFRNAGVLFFAKNVRHFFNQAYVTCLLAKGTDKVHILDRKDFPGGVVADIQDSLRFIERNTRTAYRIEGLRREDIPEYPMKALREAITNAVMHRDWFVEGANVFVEIYTDRLEISSPGGLPKGMKFSDLGRKSIRRNALLADMLHRITFIEKAGTGIKRMREEARDQHCPAPVFEENGFFTAIFYPNPEVRAQVGAKEAPSTAQVGTEKGPGRDQALAHEKAHEVEPTPQVPHKHPTSAPQVTPQVMILLRTAMREASAADLQSALHLKDRVHFLKNYLEPSLDKGLIERTIPDKPRSSKQRYRTTSAGRTVLANAEKETPS
ncbi:MAG: transcriptional regulator [Deltaproteobacteria bacterium CG23_combo_of_CG06-09_8_20_14_all_51_20]|nr:transcriptional regulator [bacterium]OIP39921.1 MAG: transcriptional regulator [Desulfobacteraceae bacterium CG2_30_51_40]PIP47181.1 MAG: transcriptional regulator [Deltaproteobacteria bacterium CG23_combo_of_CG06-09_8_20_14_all_51_20]PIY27228.1 MAG: transcriptional regulator [Deltaproteobacteria bacterium CG_4_10_14_3_um_filter_51_14]PJB34353.1 MAG: transcriptional regulator [Deltaproteobacteria bacterium CG_4_9_14_3_um_filter_51_14]